MSRFIRFGVILAVFFQCLVISSQAQLTRQQAIDTVLNQILVSDTGHINVYAAIDQMLYTDTLQLNFDTCLIMPYNYNWVFFVDDYPGANWSHPCRYVFVDSVTGNYQIANQNQFPSGFADSSYYDYECIQDIDTYPIIQLPVNTSYQPTVVEANPNLYAVIIITESAITEPKYPNNRFWYDASLIYTTLKTVYGYIDDNIFVHYYKGDCPTNDEDLDYDQIDDIDFAAEKSIILETFKNLAGTSTSNMDIPKLKSDDQLFVFVDGHGYRKDGKSYMYCNASDYYKRLYQDELADAMEGIECAQIISLFQICYSGGFADELSDFVTYADTKCKNRIIHTATEDDMFSYAEKYLTNKTYTEFTYYWAAAVRKGYSDPLIPWGQIIHQTGSFPFDDLYPVNHPDDFDPDDPEYGGNGDGFVQMEEAFYYADYMDAWSEEGFENHDYPYTYHYEEPVKVDRVGYDNGVHYNNLITLFGLAGKAEDDYLLPGRNYMSGNKISVEDGGYLRLEENSNFYFTGIESKIDIDAGGEVEIYENNSVFDAKFEVDGILHFYDYVTVYNDEINVNGELEIDDYVEIYNNDINIYGIIDVDMHDQFNDLNLNLLNPTMHTTFNYTTFNNSILDNYGEYLKITNGQFNDCHIAYSHNGNVDVSNTNFQRTWLYLENNDKFSSAQVQNCTFFTDYTMAAIDILNYPNFLIKNNTIDGYYNGIQMSQSGYGESGNHLIIGNEIKNCTMAGLRVLNSGVDLSENYIHDNNYGLKLYNNSTVALIGNPNAPDYSEMNFITDNTGYELYASAGSFPWYFRYNAIIDEDNIGNPTDPLVYAEPSGGSIMFDVKYNCWTEGEFFSPSVDLYPSNYLVYPTYCPPSSGQKSSELALQDFQEGMEYFEDEEFEDAKASFEGVIGTYPETQYAGAAMKELLALEKFLESDFLSLQEYYETNDSIQADTTLTKLAIFLGNKCEIEMENWQTAIDHFEDVIEYPDTPEDSIFAIIDLGYTYFLMENSESRSTAQGRMIEHKPNTFEAFAEKRDYLLSLLPFKKSTTEETETEIANQAQNKVFQNAPNPFTNSTTVYFNLTASAHVAFKIYDNIGKEVKIIDAASQPKGKQKVEIDMNGFPKGIYFYSMFVNGQLADSKKMIVK